MHLPPSFAAKYGPWAVITGASSGIGAQFAHQLAAAGLSVVLVARRQQRLNDLSNSIQANTSVATRTIVADLSTLQGCEKTLSETSDLNVGLLINNAGVSQCGSFFHDKLEHHINLVRVNCVAVMALAHGFGRRFADNGRGGIIFVSSMASIPVPWMALYSPSKSYVTSLGLILREELLRYGVQVMVLEPGFVESEMTEGLSMDCMATEDCVSQALNAFGSRGRFTPGWRSALVMLIRRTVPVMFQLQLLSRFITAELESQGLLTYVQDEDKLQ